MPEPVSKGLSFRLSVKSGRSSNSSGASSSKTFRTANEDDDFADFEVQVAEPIQLANIEPKQGREELAELRDKLVDLAKKKKPAQ